MTAAPARPAGNPGPVLSATIIAASRLKPLAQHGPCLPRLGREAHGSSSKVTAGFASMVPDIGGYGLVDLLAPVGVRVDRCCTASTSSSLLAVSNLDEALLLVEKWS